MPIPLPPLRDRPEDIPELVGHFLNIYNEENDRYVVHIHPQALAALQNYHWPGNVRELQNYVERAVVMATGRRVDGRSAARSRLLSATGHAFEPHSKPADLETLTYELVQQGLDHRRPAGGQPARQDRQPRRTRVDRAGDGRLRERANQSRGTKLGINRNTLHKKLKEYGLAGDE